LKVRIMVPALTVLVRDGLRMVKLAELGFTVRNEKTEDGTEYQICGDDLEKDVTLEELVRICKELKLIGTIFPDGSIALEGA
jgi:hypothetical protein